MVPSGLQLGRLYAAHRPDHCNLNALRMFYRFHPVSRMYGWFVSMSNKWAIVSKADCRFCVEAKRLLEQHTFDCAVFDIREVPAVGDLMVSAGFSTLPQVFHNGNHIGGFDDTKRYLRLIGAIHD